MSINKLDFLLIERLGQENGEWFPIYINLRVCFYLAHVMITKSQEHMLSGHISVCYSTRCISANNCCPLAI